MKKCIFVSDSFKGTLSCLDICNIARETVPEFFPGCEVVAIPMADGGEGTVDCFIQALGAKSVTVDVSDPWGKRMNAEYAVYGGTAIIEMASCAGLPLVGDKKDPSLTTTYGVGEQIVHAVKSGCNKIILGLGGSATNDGGCGAASALGVKFKNAEGKCFVPTGATLKDIQSIDVTDALSLLRSVEVTVMCDVTNPLCGETGAARIFGPQKGADEDMIEMLDSGLRHLAEIIHRCLGISVETLPGAGAAGGMGAGCVAFFSASLKSGIDTVLDLTNFNSALMGADIVFTGEGRIDSQSVHGKVISGVAKRTSLRGVPLIAIVGKIDDSADCAYDAGVAAVFSTNRAGLPFEELKDRCREDYRKTLCDVLRLIRCAERISK